MTTAPGLRAGGHAFLALLITLVWIGVLEFAVRASGHRFPGSLYLLDKERLHRTRANAGAWMTVERDTYVRTNNIGYHDQDRTVDKAPHSQRFAVLGSSDVAALYAPVEHGLTASIERELAGPEVLNFGTEGYGLSQNLFTLETEVWHFHPTVVLLVVSPRTIIWKSVPELNPEPMPYPYLDFYGTELKIVPHFVPSDWDIFYTSLSRWVVGKSQILCMAKQALDRAEELMNQKLDSLSKNRVEELPRPAQFINWGAASARPPQSALEEKAWRISEGAVHLISESCKRHHAQLWLIVLDSAIEVSPDLKQRDRFLKSNDLSDFGYLERRLKTVAERENIRFFAVGPELANYTARTGHNLHGFGRVPSLDAHLNEEGNMVVGQMIGKALRPTVQ